jgi:hypothetical protein
MFVILLILGILVTGAGFVTIGFGIPINEFNLGSTMIIAGTTAVAGGLILVGIAFAVDQLTQIAQALRPRAGSRPAIQPVEQAFPSATRPGPSPVQVPIPVPAASPSPVKPPMPAPPRAPVFANPKAEERLSEPASPESAPEVSFSAIERLRSSLGRTDRKAGDVAATEDAPYSPGGPVRGAAAPGGNAAANWGNGAAPAEGTGSGEGPKKPPLDFLFRSKAREPQPEPFDAVWPKRGARRSDEQADPGGSARPAGEAPPERPSTAETPASAPDESRPAAILKSGVVDGMAYTLYADGSIEAQLPQGTVRFGSIAELRLHIENNS